MQCGSRHPLENWILMLLLVEDLALLCLLSADALYFKNEDDNVHILVFVFGLATSITSTLSPTTFSTIYLLRLAKLVQSTTL
jgi:hypothetical protein